MLNRLQNKISSSNNSTIYLALLCLLYLFITPSYWPLASNGHDDIYEENVFYIEVVEDGISTVHQLSTPKELESIELKYSLSNLNTGNKIIVENNSTEVKRISGKKSISLGIPIGINSAGLQDLSALPGIGPELAQRILDYRDSYGDFRSIDELDKIDGIGKKKLDAIRDLTNLD